MKKLLFLFFAFCALVSIGQNAAPSGTLSLIPSPTMYYRAADSTVHGYKGTAFLWNRYLTAKDSAKLAQPIFTATRIPFGAATGGKLTDNASLTYTASSGLLQAGSVKATSATGYYINSLPMLSNYSWGGDNLNLWMGGASNSSVITGVGGNGLNGNHNLAVGSGAGSSLTSGFWNTAAGFNALNSGTSCSNNIAIGENALKLTTSGAFNAAVGIGAIMANTTGNFNTALGASALGYLNTGGANTAIGYNAGVYIADGVTPFTSGSFNFFMGQGASPLANGDNNEIVVGFNTIGLGSNTVKIGTGITKTVLGGSVGIGTDTPNEMLTVGGRVFSGSLSSGLSFSASVGNNASDNNPDIDLRRWAGSSTIHGTARMSTNASGDIVFANHQQATNTVATAEHLRITGSGDIGIGTISPSDKLEVTGNIRQTWASSIYNWMIYDNNFRQGMQYDGANRILNLFSASGDTGGGDIAFKTRLGVGSSSSDIGTEKVRIKASGFVGVGYTADPGTTNLFAVNGNSYLNGNLTVRSTGYGVGKVLTSNAYGELSYATPSGGSITSVATGLGLSGGPITTTGTIVLDTANVSVLSRQRAANAYQPKGSYITLTSLSNTAPITYNNSSGAIGITQATTSTDGYLSSTDWNTFNGKTSNTGTVTNITMGDGLASTQSPLTTTGTMKVDTSQTMILSRQRAVHEYQPKGAYNSGAGTLNYIPKYSATGSTLANSQIFDNGTFVGVGYSTDPTAQGLASKLAVNGNVAFNGIADIWLGTYSPALIGGSGTTSSLTLQSTSGIGVTGANIYFKVGSAGGSIAQTIYNNGLIGIGTTATPTGRLMIGGGSTGGVPSLVIGSGTLLAGGATVAGAIENDGTHLYYTPVAAGTRFQLDNATMTATVGGMVPTPPNNTTTYLRGDGTFATPAAGGGTVTSVSVTTANGVSGTVATATTTPAITLALGDITPSKVNTLYVDARKAGSAAGSNIWIGDGGRYSTGASASLGSYNTVSGWSAGISMTSSSFNTAYGFGSLANQTTGGVGQGQNTAVGSYSLGYISTGYNNVAIGSNAGAGVVGNSVGNTTSTNSVYIGINTVAGANGDDNEIVIGSSVIGSGSNTVTIGNSSVAKTVLNGQIVGLEYPYVAKATAYTLSVTDMMVEVTGAGTYNMTLPTAVGVTGKVYIIKKTGTSITQITTTSSQTIDGAASYNGLTSQFSKVTVMSNGTNWIIIG